MKKLKCGALLGTAMMLTVHCSVDKSSTETQASSPEATPDAASEPEARPEPEADGGTDSGADAGESSQNGTPTAEPQQITTDEDTAVDIALSGTVPEDDSLEYTVLDGPDNGTLSGNAPDLTYTPEQNFNGEDSFTFSVNDGEEESDAAVISITVNPVNDAPLADAQSLDTVEDTPLDITLGGSDIDSDTLSYEIETSPAHGVLSGDAPDVTYTPEQDFSGEDEFTFLVDDGSAQSDAVTISITVNPRNDAPLANAQSLDTGEDTPLVIALSGSDADGDTLTYRVESGPEHGDLSGDAPELTYTPDQDYSGQDSFTFSVHDGRKRGEAATVSIVVNPLNDPPMAEPQSLSVDEDAQLEISLTGSDIDGDAVTFSIVDSPSHGTLDGSGDDWTYRPAEDFTGEDSFTFSANDGSAQSDAATVSITVDPVNDPPLALAQSLTVDEDSELEITLTGSDIDGDALTFSIVDDPSNGTLDGSGDDWTYRPADDFNGEDSFTFRVNDGHLDSILATISIDVDPVNDQPVADAQSVSLDEDGELDILLTGSDIDGDSLTFSIVDNPGHGTLDGSGDDWTYQPADDFNGEDSFTFKANDGLTDSAPATVSVTVDPVNDPPVADPQSVSLDEDTDLDIVLTGSDIDGDSLTFSIVDSPANGILTGSGPNRTYLPALNFNGADSFTFRVNDGHVNSVPATISITVDPVNDRPLAHAQTVKTDKNTPVAFTLTGSDPEDSSLEYEVVDGPDEGSLTGSAPNLTYTPDADFKGLDTLTFRVNDGDLDSVPATVRILVGVGLHNILLIIGDDMGIDTVTNAYPDLIADLLGIYGDGDIDGTAASTPELEDRIFDQGVAFDNTWGQQTCSPMRASAITGLFGNRTNVGYASQDMAPHQITIPQQLLENGYATGMFGKWHLGLSGSLSRPCDVGFEIFKGNLQGGIPDFWDYDYQVQSLDSEGSPSAVVTSDAPEVTISVGDEELITTYAPAVKVVDTMDWIAAQEAEDPNRPWFAWLAFNTPHTPLHEPEDAFLDSIARDELASCRPSCSSTRRLRAMINALDTVVGVLVDHVEALDPNTVVIFVGDNGTVASTIDNMYLTTSGRGKTTNYESGIRIPLAIKGPGIEQGVVSTEFVHVVDLFATALELAGVDPPTSNYAYNNPSEEIASDSVSLVPILEGASSTVRDHVLEYTLSEKFGGFFTSPSAAARNGTYKLICWDDACSEHEFYNLIDDPLEENALDTSGYSTEVETPGQDSPDESFFRLQDIILTESYFSRTAGLTGVLDKVKTASKDSSTDAMLLPGTSSQGCSAKQQ